MTRYRLAPEWECWPLWDAQTGDNVDPATLDLPPDLLARLNAWDAAFQETLDRDDPLASIFPDAAAEASYADEGEKLRQLLTEAGLSLQDR